jgi:SET domain-containing protein
MFADQQQRQFVPGYICPDICLCYIDEVMGHGVFAISDLAAGEMLGEYTGVLQPCSSSRQCDYALSYPSSETGSYEVNAAAKGNLIRFVNHSCSANSSFQSIFHSGILHVICVTKDPITAGQQVTVNYGKGYWQKMGIDPLICCK